MMTIDIINGPGRVRKKGNTLACDDARWLVVADALMLPHFRGPRLAYMSLASSTRAAVACMQREISAEMSCPPHCIPCVHVDGEEVIQGGKPRGGKDRGEMSRDNTVDEKRRASFPRHDELVSGTNRDTDAGGRLPKAEDERDDGPLEVSSCLSLSTSASTMAAATRRRTARVPRGEFLLAISALLKDDFPVPATPTRQKATPP
jgi:hypothetical protein